MTVHRYSLHGLRVDSALAGRAAPGEEGPADVVVTLGEVPDELPGARHRGVLYESSPGAFRLALEGVAEFLVRDGREIVVAPAPGAEPETLRQVLFGMVMGALLHQRGLLPLHASAIELAGRAVVFAGPSGSGKSSLAAAFHRSGHPVLADDLLAVTGDGGGPPRALSAAPEVRLAADAIARLGTPAPRTESRSGDGKHCLPVRGPGAGEPVPISHVYLLAAPGGDRFELDPLAGAAKLTALIDSTYHPPFLGCSNRHFDLCVALARHARVTRVSRPGRGHPPREMARRLERDARLPARDSF